MPLILEVRLEFPETYENAGIQNIHMQYSSIM